MEDAKLALWPLLLPLLAEEDEEVELVCCASRGPSAPLPDEDEDVEDDSELERPTSELVVVASLLLPLRWGLVTWGPKAFEEKFESKGLGLGEGDPLLGELEGEDEDAAALEEGGANMTSSSKLAPFDEGS